MLFSRDDGTFVFYHYQPSLAAAVLFTVLFGSTTLTHLVQLLRARTYFLVPFFIGGIFETIGYIGRILSAEQNPGPYTLGPFVMQSTLLLVAPALLAASIYMQLGRIVHMLQADRLLFIPRRWLTRTFVCGDIFSFLLQAAGAGILSTGGANNATGKDIIVGGLFLQIIFFGLFVVASAIFHVRLLRDPTAKSLELPWYRLHLLSIYVVSGLIFIRSIVRVVEYLEGYTGYVMTHEAFMYVFDALLMFVAMTVMNVIHPAQVAKELRGKGESGVRIARQDLEMKA